MRPGREELIDTLLLITGVALIGGIFVDALATTLTVSAGAGPLTRWSTATAWRGILRIFRAKPAPRVFAASGAMLLLGTVILWITGLWAGWSLVFVGSDAIVDASTNTEASWPDVVYYTGFTVFTLGTGDFIASSPGWRLATAVATFNGLFLVTLAITYLLSVVSAVVTSRALATQIYALGTDATEVVANAWNGTAISGIFQQQLVALLSPVTVAAEQHLAYPVLHYFHARDRAVSAAPAIAQLDDALTLLTHAVAEEYRPDPNATKPLQHAVRRYVEATNKTSWQPCADVPPIPDLEPLRNGGIPLAESSVILRAFRHEAERRERLHRLVVSDGWSWRR